MEGVTVGDPILNSAFSLFRKETPGMKALGTNRALANLAGAFFFLFGYFVLSGDLE